MRHPTQFIKKINPYLIPAIAKPAITRITLYEIEGIVCKEVGISTARTKDRKRQHVIARQLVWYFANIYAEHFHKTEITLTDMGAFFGRNHATVLHGIRQINDIQQFDRELAMTCRNIDEQIKLKLNI
ncbi:MAG: helix-turn-helix domain-containing protein [Bacteroidales bacterium]